MREFAIRCPNTSLPVATGEKTHDRKIRKCNVRRLVKACPACGGPHDWLVKDAWLIEEVTDDPPPQNGDQELL
jgi:hypothetical protein